MPSLDSVIIALPLNKPLGTIKKTVNTYTTTLPLYPPIPISPTTLALLTNLKTLYARPSNRTHSEHFSRRTLQTIPGLIDPLTKSLPAEHELGKHKSNQALLPKKVWESICMSPSATRARSKGLPGMFWQVGFVDLRERARRLPGSDDLVEMLKFEDVVVEEGQEGLVRWWEGLNKSKMTKEERRVVESEEDWMEEFLKANYVSQPAADRVARYGV
jgi:hypothetical protein